MDQELATIIHNGIRDSACPILTDEVIAAHRLPIPLRRMDAIFKGFPRGTACEQRGEWLVILKGKAAPERRSV